MSIQIGRSTSVNSTEPRNLEKKFKFNKSAWKWLTASYLEATANKASAGQGWNQSMVQQLTIAGNFRTRFLNESPIGDIDKTQ